MHELGTKIAIVGSPGSGKSTFARKLAEATGLPLHHLDALYWGPGWVRRHTADEWSALQSALVAGDRWIIDGNYHSTLDIRIAAADTVIFLDVSPWRALWNIFARIRHFSADSRPDMSVGCPERLDWKLVRVVLGYPRHGRPRVTALADAHGTRLVILCSRSETRAFLEALSKS
jgi:adenylate kinase family enzyme